MIALPEDLFAVPDFHELVPVYPEWGEVKQLAMTVCWITQLGEDLYVIDVYWSREDRDWTAFDLGRFHRNDTDEAIPARSISTPTVTWVFRMLIEGVEAGPAQVRAHLENYIMESWL